MRLLLSSVHWQQDLAQNLQRLPLETVPTLQQGRLHTSLASPCSHRLFLSMALCSSPLLAWCQA